VNLEEKQAYYEYSGGWSYKEPPTLDRELYRRLQEIDPNLFLIWCGVAVYRDTEDGPPIKVRGDHRATKFNHGRLTARKVSGRAIQFCGYTFKLKNGREKTVMREDAIPRSKRKLAVCRYEYVDYGILRWCLFRYLTAEQCIAAEIYTVDNPPPPEGDLVHRLTVETPDGLYWEPDRAWVEMVGKSTFETFNTPLSDLYHRDKDVREQRDQQREEREAKQTCIQPEALLKFTIDQRNL
jgi:hypothetical protein